MNGIVVKDLRSSGVELRKEETKNASACLSKYRFIEDEKTETLHNKNADWNELIVKLFNKVKKKLFNELINESGIWGNGDECYCLIKLKSQLNLRNRF